MYNPRINRITCPFCGVEMRPYGERFSPWAKDVEDMFLCIRCGHWIDMQYAVADALYQMAVIKRRYAYAQGYFGTNGHANGNGHKPSLRQRVVKFLVRMLDDEKH